MNFIFSLLLAVWSFTGCKQEEVLPQEPPASEESYKNLKYLALGDSYTIGQSVAVADRWPNLLDAKLESEGIFIDSTQIIARTGWTTANLQAAIDQADLLDRYDLVSILIGVNNQFQGRTLTEYRVQFEELLLEAIELAGGDSSRVFVVSIPDYGFTPFGASNQGAISTEVKIFNEACREITLQYNIAYYNITPISQQGFVDPDLVASDGLHPSGKQYAEWVEQMFQHVALQITD